MGCNGTISESSEPESDPNKSLVDDIAATATKTNGDQNGPTSSTGVTSLVDDRSMTSRSESLESDIFEEAPPGTPIGMTTFHSRKSMDESMKSFRLPISRNRQESTSLQSHPILDDNLQDFHQHRLLPGKHPLDINYNMYGMVVS